MPVFLRRFYLKQVEKSLKEEADAHTKASGKSKGISRPPRVKK